MSTHDPQLQRIIDDFDRRLKNIENDIKHLNSRSGHWSVGTALHKVSANLSNIREMFLLEILREKGLLDNLEIEALRKKVSQQLAEKDIPWGASKDQASKNINKALAEIAGDYYYDDDDDDDDDDE